jgi:hypothetical protein
VNDRPRLKVTEADAMAAVERDDSQWLVDNVFIPALAQIVREEHTAALVNGLRPRARRSADPRRHSQHRTRRFPRHRQ